MVDTVKLMLDKSMLAMVDKSKFEKDITNPSRGYFTLVQNPTTTELKSGIYKPKLTLTNRFNCSGRLGETLAIEFSAPKLVFGNNFDEVADEDFSNVIQKLKAVLKDMGVYVFENNLQDALVSSIHYSKNIALTDYSTPYTYIEQLAKLNINKKLDTNRTDFRNEGHSFKYHANTFEVVFYDKIRDLQKGELSDKRAEEKDNAIQLSLLDLLKKQKPLEVLRVEIRLNGRSKIRQILKKVDVVAEPTFTNIFNQKIAKKVLLHYINEIEGAYPPILAYKHDSHVKTFKEILRANPDLKPTQALELTCFRGLLDEIGVREYRQIIEPYGNYYWYNLNRKMKELKQPDTTEVFSKLRTEIEKFEPLRLVAIHDRMIRNDKNEQ
ncbi:hypothetical protein A2982_00625 [candidate division WWE3 bacterium RIFCSPLOWO2_01_FULL_39_13]|uniref:Replication-associated protein G2P N-terminal domain-containing protein n=1 Tax=candidate division WWE3 bacterium RIFCSPLOWO2_01_FULL_39_13 TaxID=1802624 RepID=A0A1F4V405_UNCKA|nr:MAG: hypothetical protein A2982_00625 [candidate division WWE3 bacterium RIFCSPLOWO2_01_FULL_39_13]